MTAAVALARRTPVEDSLLASFAAAEQREAPYRTWRLADVFPEATARALSELPIQAVELGGISGKRELHNDQRSYFAGEALDRHPVARDVAEALQSEPVAHAIMQRTGARLEGCCLRIEYAIDVSGFWLEPHTDLGVKTFTMLYYLGGEGQADLGTDLYAARDRWAERVPFDWNSAIVFVPSDNTWHGFEPRRIATPRRSVIINYVTADWRAREQLAFPDDPIK
jgi:hypothetical protein